MNDWSVRNDGSRCAGTTKLWLSESRDRTTEEMSLQPTPENSQWRCRRDMLQKTVPNTSCGDWKRLVLV